MSKMILTEDRDYVIYSKPPLNKKPIPEELFEWSKDKVFLKRSDKNYVLSEEDICLIDGILFHDDDLFDGYPVCQNCELHDYVSSGTWYIKDEKVYCSNCKPQASKTYEEWWNDMFPNFGSVQDWKFMFRDEGIMEYEGNDGGCVYYNINLDSQMCGKIALTCYDGHGRTGIYTFSEDPKIILNELCKVGSIHKYLESKEFETDFG